MGAKPPLLELMISTNEVNPSLVLGMQDHYFVTLHAPSAKAIQWSIQGTIPPSWIPANVEKIRRNKLCLGGSVTKEGVYQFTVWAQDGSGNLACQLFSVFVKSPNSATIAPIPWKKLAVGENFAYQLKARKFSAPVIWSITKGSLPLGLYFDSLKGVIHGMPLMPGAYAFIISATDGLTKAEYNALLDIEDVETVYSDHYIINAIHSLGRDERAKIPLFQLKRVMQNISVPESFPSHSLFAFALGLPEESIGLRQGSNGTVYYIQHGMWIQSKTQPCMEVSYPLKAIVGQKVSFRCKVVGLTEPIVWSLMDGLLPPGLKLHPYTGDIEGNLKDAGVYPFTIRAADHRGVWVKKECAWNIANYNTSADRQQLEYVPEDGQRNNMQIQVVFDRCVEPQGGIFFAQFLVPSTFAMMRYFDIHCRTSRGEEVILNWQHTLAAEHQVPADAQLGYWEIMKVRPHSKPGDHEGEWYDAQAKLEISRATADEEDLTLEKEDAQGAFTQKRYVVPKRNILLSAANK